MGVLGFLSPGLMAVLPIDTRTQVLLYDGTVYKPSAPEGCFDIRRPSDVLALNAQQILAAEENVYFFDEDAMPYVHDLLVAHRRFLPDNRSKVLVHQPGTILVNGIPNRNEILHMFQPHPVALDLSFISTARMPDDERPNRPRSPELAERVLEQREFRKSAGMAVDKLGKEIEFHL
jgi:hypothetical protein